MSNLLSLRDYQRECIQAIHSRWDAGVTRPAVVLPTGAGKTIVFAHLAEEFLANNPGKRVLVLAHTDELVGQAVVKMRQVAPHRTVGVVKASQNETHAQVIIGSVQTLRNEKRRNQLRNVGLIIVDEAHHATAITYRTILEHFGALGRTMSLEGNADDFEAMASTLEKMPTFVMTAGFTATLARGDQAKLSDIWESVAFQRDITYMIRRGYLIDVKGHRVIVPDLDLSQVRQSGGDYQEGALADELERSLAPEVVAEAYITHAADRRGIGFAPTVESAYSFSAAFNDAGIRSDVIHGALPREERRLLLKRRTAGEIQVLWGCMVLTEGFDAPDVSCVIVARATRSAPLYQQMVGRALRPDLTLPAAARGHALILDVVGASRQHDLRTLVDLSEHRVRDDYDEYEDLSLLELEDLWEQEQQEADEAIGAHPPEDLYTGPVSVEEFDPLARQSDRVWQRTAGGSYFLPAGPDAYVFLVDTVAGEPGTLDVVMCTSNPGQALPGQSVSAALTEHRGLPMEMALSWAEDVCMELGGDMAAMLADKGRAWRRTRASDKQVRMAQRLGIVVPMREYDGERVPDIRKGELFDQINIVMASNRIDSLVKRVKG